MNSMPTWLIELRHGLAAGKTTEALWPGLTPDDRRKLKREWRFRRRDEQLLPKGDWLTWLILGGRGSGKTRAGAEWVRGIATGKWPYGEPVKGPIALVGDTLADAREVMIEGVSGLLSIHRDDERPKWVPSRRMLFWPQTGAIAQTFSSEDPESLRGPQFAAAWADGKPFDLSAVTHRFHPGDATQAVDSLIEAKQGDAPAYRDTATIVFERLPLEDFGNRLPQLSFEVIRPVAGVENDIRAVTLIPGSTEFGYDPEPVWKVIAPGNRVPLNRHVDGAKSDWQASLDELMALCPNLERVALVVAWFGDDLRADACTLMPAVTDRTTTTQPAAWQAAGLTRATARLVSTYDGKPAYGGTPSDASVVRAIADLDARGIKVTFLPFVMMDIPAGNGLPDPYGGDEQAAHPWRGEITLSVAPGEPGSPDKTAAAADEVAAFAGSAAAGHFGASGGLVTYSGPTEWSFRRFILHYAKLCDVAGGVDAFLIGSELRGLTTIRSGANTYPFVAELVDLAAEVRSILGGGTKISYAADWSEYFGHQPADGSGDVFFHLDPLWAGANIDFVGIDNYLPLADWRDGSSHLDAETWESGRDAAYFRANIAGGERYDWYYASDADRDAQVRTPITDGAG